MTQKKHLRVAYILKMYPRFSETFIVNEILAHEKSGIDIEIYSLRNPVDGRFHDSLSRVRGNVTYIDRKVSAQRFWELLQTVAVKYPGFLPKLEKFKSDNSQEMYQALSIAIQLHGKDIDHIHVHFANVAASVAKIVTMITGIPFTMTTHAKDIFHEDVLEDELRGKIAASKATIAISDYNYSFLAKMFPELKSKLIRIYNGLELDKFTFHERNPKSKKILAIGRLVEKKGMDVLIDACKILEQDGNEFSCEIVGTGYQFEYLQTKIEDAGLTNTVKLIGAQPQWRVKELLRDAMVFAAPCIVGKDGNRDGLPTVLLESMATGLPCVSTDVTAIPEIIRNGESGYLVAQHDPKALAETLRMFLQDEAQSEQIAKTARSIIENNFDIERNTYMQRQLFSDKSDYLEKTA